MKITALLVLKCDPKTPEPVILANVSKLLQFEICNFYRSNFEEFIVFIARTVAKRTPPGQCQSVKHEEYKVHAYNINGLCAVGFTDDHYPVRSAFSLLDQVLDAYQTDFGETWRSAKSSQPWPYLKEALEKYQDPVEIVFEKLFKIQKEMDETKIILYETIDDVLGRDEELDSLVERSTKLSLASKMFYKQAKKTKSCCTIL
ncbi:Synaptobrevin [Arabidopsis suecica]|uniref:Synaptobrevin n=1 Tax=Arabidopsis suecica TaxID=45249 RepID=A0A8T1XW89_ARASU|nr:Synaptobrevin [Arabidopsis suecica]